MSELPFVGGLIVIGLALTYNNYFTYNYVYVEIDKGILRGFNTTTWRGIPYFSFKGIPYAKPPLGELRFKGPQEEAAWSGVRDTLSHGNVCPQVDLVFRVYRGQEDCLFLNVYTPSMKADRMATMVFIHGGMFLLGSGNNEYYGPDYFMEAGVVLVTINYRLGALGFLSTGDDGASGNAGLKDQVAALRWIRRNIAKFGGDPDNVTIFGGSSGSACVQYHLLSPLSAGLFSRGIGQSGSLLSTWALCENGPQSAVRLAEILGAGALGGDVKKALKFLEATPSEDIVIQQTAMMTPQEVRTRIPFLFCPSVEKNVQSGEVFMLDRPFDNLKSGNFNIVPYMTGYTSHEGYFFVEEITDPEWLKAATEDTERFVPLNMKNEVFREDFAKSIRTFYFDNAPIATEDTSNYVDLISDITFLTPINRATKLQLMSSTMPVYFYVFSYDGKKNILKSFSNVQTPGASHGDELGYLFHQELLFWKRPMIDSDDEYVIQTMIRLWTNFAKYGDPTPAGDPLSWKPTTVDKFNYLNISGRDMKMNVNPYFERTNFWAEAYDKYEALQCDMCCLTSNRTRTES